MRRTFARICVMFLVVCCGALTSPARAQAVSQETLDDLRSQDVDRILRAAKEIAQSTDDRAWEALRTRLREPELYALVEKRSRARPRGGGLEEKCREVAELFNFIAGGEPSRAIPTLIELADNTDDGPGETGRARRILLVGAFKYIRQPTPELLRYCDEKLQKEALWCLAAYGTPESLIIFKKYAAGPSLDALQKLAAYRDRYENTRYVLHLIRERSLEADMSAKAFHRILGYFIIDESISQGRAYPPLRLPPIEPRGEEAQRFAELFKDFLANPGKIELTEAEKTKLQELIERCEKGAKEKPAPESTLQPSVPPTSPEVPRPEPASSTKPPSAPAPVRTSAPRGPGPSRASRNGSSLVLWGLGLVAVACATGFGLYLLTRQRRHS